MVESVKRRILLGGGIGSGKSTVAALFATHGALVIDADRVGHEVLEPGEPAYRKVMLRWPEVVRNGTIDRATLACVVFADPDALDELERITHPAIARTIEGRVAGSDADVVVVEVPLLKLDLDGDWIVVFVDAPEQVRLARLAARGMAESDARARMAAQPSRDEWLTAADHVIANSGTEPDLSDAVARLWQVLGDS